MKNHLLFFCFLLFFGISQAQVDKSKWGSLNKEEINYKSVPFAKSAAAVILSEKGSMSIINGGYVLNVTRRIKILTQEGIDKANLELRYYAKEGIENIGAIKAQTLNEVNGKIEVTTVNSKEIFDVKQNELYNVKRLAFPNVKIGSVIEYQYQLNSKSNFVIDAWDFQHDIPTVNSKFDLEIRANMDYNTLLFGTALINKYKNNLNIKSWELSNIPSWSDVNYLYNAKGNGDKIRFQLKAYLGASGYENTISTWKNLASELLDSYSKFTNTVAVKALGQQIPDGATEEETFKNVVNFFSSNFKDNRIKGIYINTSQKNIIDNRIGSVADLNSLFYQLLKTKGIKTDLVLLSTRPHGKIMVGFPYVSQFDFLVNMVTINESTYVIDASNIDKNQYKFAPLYLFNDYGFRLDQSESFVKLNQYSSTYEANFIYKLSEKGIQQSRQEKLNGYFYNESIDDNSLINGYINQPINTVFDEEKKIEGQFINENYQIKSLGNQPILPTLVMVENPLKRLLSTYEFNEENRQAQIEFNFPFLYNITVDVSIPEGYELNLPKDFEQLVQIDDVIYYQKAVSSNKQLKVLYQFKLGKAVFDSKDYLELKRTFQKINEHAQKSIILKKK